MFSSFMVDDSNIFGFEGGENVIDGSKYSVEWWIFKPEENGQQVFHSEEVIDSDHPCQ